MANILGLERLYQSMSDASRENGSLAVQVIVNYLNELIATKQESNTPMTMAEAQRALEKLAAASDEIAPKLIPWRTIGAGWGEYAAQIDSRPEIRTVLETVGILVKTFGDQFQIGLAENTIRNLAQEARFFNNQLETVPAISGQ